MEIQKLQVRLRPTTMQRAMNQHHHRNTVRGRSTTGLCLRWTNELYVRPANPADRLPTWLKQRFEEEEKSKTACMLLFVCLSSFRNIVLGTRCLWRISRTTSERVRFIPRPGNVKAWIWSRQTKHVEYFDSHSVWNVVLMVTRTRSPSLVWGFDGWCPQAYSVPR